MSREDGEHELEPEPSRPDGPDSSGPDCDAVEQFVLMLRGQERIVRRVEGATES